MQATDTGIFAAGPGGALASSATHGVLSSFFRRISVPEKLKNPVRKVVGATYCLAVLIGFLALASWNASDPSITYANGKEVQNWLGYWGASFADLSMQFFGFAAVVLLFPPFVWGLYKLTNRPLTRLRYRLLAWVLALVCFSTALGCLNVLQGWPLPVGLGGVVGDAVLNIPAAFTGGYPEGLFAVSLGCIMVPPGLFFLARSCDLHRGVTARRPAGEMAESSIEFHNGDEDGFEVPQSGHEWSAILTMPLGLLIHLGYSARTLLRNFNGKRAEAKYLAAQEQLQTIHQEPVIEPNFDASASQWADDDMAEMPDFAEEPQVLVRERAGAPEIPVDPPVPHTDAAQASAPQVVRKVTAKPKSNGGKYVLPQLDLLSEERNLVQDPSLSKEALEENARILEGVLDDFGVKGQIIQVRPGPVVTLYELEPAPGIKSSRVIGLADDIARSMSAIAARVAVVPGRNAIGIELPNKVRETVYLREQLSSGEFKKSKAKLPMCLGKTIGGEPVIADMAKMPHLLVAGTTGSGKSVAINTMILSLLFRHSPEKCKLIMIDPKMLELSIYDGIPHLLTPVVVDPKKAVVALKWTVREMEDRYKKMSKVGVRNIDGFNSRVAEAAKNGESITRTVQTGFDRETGEAIYETEELDLEAMPYIVVVIDEMADLMMVAGKDIEGTVQRLAQMARAAGIHVIMATQRPSTDVITGTIKANFPTRISFQVTSKIDSRVMLGESGAEQLLGMGDMLYMAGGGRITRVHGPFVDDHEVEDVVNHLKTQGVPQYLEAITEEDEEEEGDAASGSGGSAGGMGDSDDPYDKAVAIVLQDRKASTSYIQRRLSVGYNKAASLIERMEQEGLISPANHAGKREILVPDENEVM